MDALCLHVATFSHFFENCWNLFLNISALHQPNCFYLPEATHDTLESHAAALIYVDTQLPPLFHALRKRAPLLALLCSDHGPAYGEDGYSGHRLAHPVVWTVPLPETSPNMDKPYPAFGSCFIQSGFTACCQTARATVSTGFTSRVTHGTISRNLARGRQITGGIVISIQHHAALLADKGAI